MSVSSSASSDSEYLKPENIVSDANNVIKSLLPEKSRLAYLKAYENFILWKHAKEAKSFSENVFLAYFQELSKTKQPSTHWSTYSMLKSTVRTNNDVKIENYSKLTAYLKRLSEGHKRKKSKVFSGENVEKFLNEAPDEIYLLTKVVLIFGIYGACRSKELLDLTIEDVQAKSDELTVVKLRDTKTKVDRSFVIRGAYKPIVDKYQILRPPDMKSNRFFVRYQNGKCTRNPIGKNKFSGMPQEIASYLKLPDVKLYTGHCFRRTSATLLADSGADMSLLMRHGGWRSTTVAEGYVEESLDSKTKISNRIVETVNLKEPRPSTSKEPSSDISNSQAVVNKTITITDSPNKTVTMHFNNCTNININI